MGCLRSKKAEEKPLVWFLLCLLNFVVDSFPSALWKFWAPWAFRGILEGVYVLASGTRATADSWTKSASRCVTSGSTCTGQSIVLVRPSTFFCSFSGSFRLRGFRGGHRQNLLARVSADRLLRHQSGDVAGAECRAAVADALPPTMRRLKLSAELGYGIQMISVSVNAY